MRSSHAIRKRNNLPIYPDKDPSVVVTLPFMPVMMSKSQLDTSLKETIAEAERRLLAHHSRQVAMPVISRLHEAVEKLNYATHHKSIVIEADLHAARTLYLDIPVTLSVHVDEEFHLRQLTIPDHAQTPFLVMLLSSKVSKIFRYDGCKLSLIKNNKIHPVYAYSHQLPEKVANFTDVEEKKEELMDKFLRHMDEGLSIILESFHLPVVVMGVERVVGHFNRITRNSRHIAVCVSKNLMRAPEPKLMEALQPYMADWEDIREKLAFKQVEDARIAGKLIGGLEEVRTAISQRNSRLLVLENRFAKVSGTEAIDGIIEKLLVSGGQVEWVQDGLLSMYGGIALVRHY